MASAIATNLVDEKYGRLYLKDPSESVAPGYHDLDDVDEPVFVLRAQDDFALHTLTRYRNTASSIEDESVRPSEAWFAGLDGVIAAFAEFRQDHADKIKVPD